MNPDQYLALTRQYFIVCRWYTGMHSINIMLNIKCSVHIYINLYNVYTFSMFFWFTFLNTWLELFFSGFFFIKITDYTFKGFIGLHFWCLYGIFTTNTSYATSLVLASNMLSTMPLTSVLDNHWTQAKSCFKAVVTISDVSYKAHAPWREPESNCLSSARPGWRAPGKSSFHPCSELPHLLLTQRKWFLHKTLSKFPYKCEQCLKCQLFPLPKWGD